MKLWEKQAPVGVPSTVREPDTRPFTSTNSTLMEGDFGPGNKDDPRIREHGVAIRMGDCLPNLQVLPESLKLQVPLSQAMKENLSAAK
uniref:Uncharacterized protein n=1 Tax=Haemonchus contortus TaxID=6289 RepID=A0A7I5EDE3_HAECO